MLRKILFYIIWAILVVSIIFLVGAGLGGFSLFYEIVA